MRKAACLIAMALALPLLAQEKNPVSSAIRSVIQGRAKNIVAAAEEMPAEKYNFRPTADQMSFAHLIMHTAETNSLLCSKLGSATAPKTEVKEADPKEKLIEALKRSFDFCTGVLGKLDDSNLGETLTLFGERQGTRAEALIILASTWADHYAEEAMYLRLNSLLPPTAKKK